MSGKLGRWEMNQEEEVGHRRWLHAPPRIGTWAIALRLRDACDDAWMIGCQRFFLRWRKQAPMILVVGSSAGDDGRWRRLRSLCYVPKFLKNLSFLRTN